MRVNSHVGWLFPLKVTHSRAERLAHRVSALRCLVNGGMSGAGARLNVFPTRQNLQVMKVKLVGAKKGHSLLKKKADALTMRLRLLLRNILKAKEDMGSAFREGNFALAEVKYAAGDIKPTVIESVGVAQKKVEIRVDNIAGVKVPVFKVRRPPLPPDPSSPSLAAGECAP